MSSNRLEANDRPIDEPDQPPAKKQRLLSKVCETCKLKKSKCDSLRPQCSTCKRQGAECIYREKGQPGLRPGYGKAMESRMDNLDSNMAELKQSMGDVLERLQQAPAPEATSVVACNSPASLNMAATADIAPGIDQPLLESGIYATEERWEPPLRLDDGASFIPELEPNKDADAVKRGLLHQQDTGNTLPPGNIVSKLVELFFKHVYPSLPIFYKPTLLSNMELPSYQVVLHGIVVVSFRYWNRTEPSPAVRNSYVQSSRKYILLRAVESSTLLVTQALALLALDALGQGSGPRSWNMMSLLVTSSKHLELSKSHYSRATDRQVPLVGNGPDDDVDASIVQADERNRLFWAICSLDRLSSISHGQPGGIDMKSVKLSYPKSDNDWGQNTPPTWYQAPMLSSSVGASASENLWHHYIDLLAFADHSNQFLIQPINLTLPARCQEWQSNFRRLDINLSTWLETLPGDIRRRPSSFEPVWTMLHATFYLIRTRMYTVAAFPSTSSPYVKPSPHARLKCRETIRLVAELARPLTSEDLDYLCPMFAFALWVAARSLIILWTTNIESSTGPDMDVISAALDTMGKRWPCAERYNSLIKLVIGSNEQCGRQAILDVFNDTRRTSYGLEKGLGSFTSQQYQADESSAFDFLNLDLPIFDNLDYDAPSNCLFGLDRNDDWLWQ